MIDKIVLSNDRKSLTICYDTHNVGLCSDVDVLVLLWETIFEPSIRLQYRAKQKEIRLVSALEDTVDIDLSTYWDDVG